MSGVKSPASRTEVKAETNSTKKVKKVRGKDNKSLTSLATDENASPQKSNIIVDVSISTPDKVYSIFRLHLLLLRD